MSDTTKPTRKRPTGATVRGNLLQAGGTAAATWGAFNLFGPAVTWLAVGLVALALGTLIEAGRL